MGVLLDDNEKLRTMVGKTVEVGYQVFNGNDVAFEGRIIGILCHDKDDTFTVEGTHKWPLYIYANACDIHFLDGYDAFSITVMA